ncbi:GIY-YIG nuclease family protein [Luteibacter sahnii]|uniref:GIY-YIG nuclease family protein n=1 Tax=Luteibacter sahnii TaxID=3021977 RepID=UPI002A6B8C71|nr:GIY-YIG nuclease family protein [Luteibacter sp. PPL193]
MSSGRGHEARVLIHGESGWKGHLCVYLLASGYRGTLYFGVTSHLVQRVWQHREAGVDGFTKRFGVTRLAWFEVHEVMACAMLREKALKHWHRAWKRRLIEAENPQWHDLYESLL